MAEILEKIAANAVDVASNTNQIASIQKNFAKNTDDVNNSLKINRGGMGGGINDKDIKKMKQDIKGNKNKIGNIEGKIKSYNKRIKHNEEDIKENTDVIAKNTKNLNEELSQCIADIKDNKEIIKKNNNEITEIANFTWMMEEKIEINAEAIDQHTDMIEKNIIDIVTLNENFKSNSDESATTTEG